MALGGNWKFRAIYLVVEATSSFSAFSAFSARAQERFRVRATDDLNPLELWRARKAEFYRAFLIEKPGVDVFL